MVIVTGFFCLDLRVTTLLIGWLELGFTLLCLLVTGCIFALRDWFIDQIWTRYQNPIDYEKLDAVYTVFYIYIAVITIALVLKSLIDIALIVGGHKRKPNYLLPWMVLTAFRLAFVALILLATIFLAFHRAETFYAFITAAAFESILAYLFLAIVSFYQSLTLDDEVSLISSPYLQPSQSDPEQPAPQTPQLSHHQQQLPQQQSTGGQL